MYTAYLLKRDVITAAGDNLSLLSISDENQLSDENLGIETRTWTALVDLEAEHDLTAFFSAVRKICCYHQQNASKFPFGDLLLKDTSTREN